MSLAAESLARPLSQGSTLAAFIPLDSSLSGRAFFVFGFAKGEQANIDDDEEVQFRKMAKELLALSDEQMAVLVERRRFFEKLAYAGLPVICIETRHVKAFLKAQADSAGAACGRGAEPAFR